MTESEWNGLAQKNMSQKQADIPESFSELDQIISSSMNMTMDHHVRDLCCTKAAEYTKQRFKSLKSKKARVWLNNRVFFDKGEYDGVKYYVAYRPHDVQEHRFSIYYCIMKEYKSSKGRIFTHAFEVSESSTDKVGTGTIFMRVFTAHFFDRVLERSGLNGSRYDAIKVYLSDNVIDNIKRISFELYQHPKCPEGELSVIGPFGDGLALGHTICDGKASLMKTYVSSDQIKGWQKRKYQDIIDDIPVHADKMNEAMVNMLKAKERK